MEEIWRDIPDWESYYQASNWGRIRSVDRLIFDKGHGSFKERKGRILTLMLNKRNNYLHAHLSKKGRRTSLLVHRLVYSAFYGPIPEGMEVNHINEDKLDNRPENLNLMTPKENTNWGTGKERRKRSYESNGSREIAVEQYGLNGAFIKRWKSAKKAANCLGLTSSGITRCCQKIYKKSQGYIWRYEKEKERA